MLEDDGTLEADQRRRRDLHLPAGRIGTEEPRSRGAEWTSERHDAYLQISEYNATVTIAEGEYNGAVILDT
jgi:hypothetical protein